MEVVKAGAVCVPTPRSLFLRCPGRLLEGNSPLGRMTASLKRSSLKSGAKDLKSSLTSLSCASCYHVWCGSVQLFPLPLCCVSLAVWPRQATWSKRGCCWAIMKQRGKLQWDAQRHNEGLCQSQNSYDWQGPLLWLPPPLPAVWSEAAVQPPVDIALWEDYTITYSHISTITHALTHMHMLKQSLSVLSVW